MVLSPKRCCPRKVLLARKHVEEEILTSKCPRPHCRQAFLEFDGCCALKCSNCPCRFCAWCGVDCGNGSNDAHNHVAACGAKPDGADVFYPGSLAEVFSARAKFWHPALEAFLRGLEEGTRGALLRVMQGTLRELYSRVLDMFEA